MRAWVLVLLLAAACDEGGPPPTVLRVTPNPALLGRVAVGGVARQTLVLQNVGTTAAVLGPVEIGPVLAGELRLVGLPERIPAGAIREVGLVYAPRTAGTRSDVVVFTAEGASPTRVRVDASAVAEELRFAPAALDLGPVALGDTRTATVTLTLSGASPLDLSTATVLGDPDFQTIPSFPQRLFPGNSVEVVVLYRPTSVGRAGAELFFGAGERVFGPLPLAGTGLSAEVAIEPELSLLGAVVVGDTKAHVLRLASRARTAHQVVLSLRGDREAFGGLEALTGTITLEAGDDRHVPITFAPRAVATASVTVVARVDGGPPRALATVLGRGLADPRAPFVLAPADLDLGPVQVGATLVRSLWLENGSELDRPIDPFVEVVPAEAPLVVALPQPLGPVMRGRDRHRLELVARPLVEGPVDAVVVVAGARARVRLVGVADPVGTIAAPAAVDLGVLVGLPLADARAIEVESTGTATVVVTASVSAEPGQVPWPARIERADVLGVGSALGPGQIGALRLRPRRGAADVEQREASLRGDDPRGPAATIALTARTGRIEGRALCVEAMGAGAELHLVPRASALRDAPFAASACASRAQDSAGAGWSVGAPGPDGVCAVRLDPESGGEILVAVTLPAARATFALVTIGPPAGPPIASRWMSPGSRWDVGWARGSGLELIDAPLGRDAPSRCF